MSELEKQTAELQGIIQKQLVSARRNARILWIVYIFLVVFVFLYTRILYLNIQAAATPSNVAELLASEVRSNLPAMTKSIQEQMKPTAQSLAVKSVEALTDLIGEGGRYARVILRDQTEVLLSEMQKEHMPQIEEILDGAIADILKDQDAVKDGKFSEKLSSLVAAQIDEELSQIINEKFYVEVNSLEKRLVEIRDASPLSVDARAVAEKRLILYWLYLNECAAKQDTASPLSSVVSSIDGTLAEIASQLTRPATDTDSK